MSRRHYALLALCLSLTACGSDDPESPEAPRDASTVDASDAGSLARDTSVPTIDATIAEDAALRDASVDSSADSGIDASSDASTDAGRDTGPVNTGDPVRYADVAPIFGKYCTSCHRPNGEGPFALDNYDDAADFGAQAYGAASARIMPPCAESDPSCGPNSDELARLRNWVLQDFPE
jgi:hypothetical protein